MIQREVAILLNKYFCRVGTGSNRSIFDGEFSTFQKLEAVGFCAGRTHGRIDDGIFVSSQIDGNVGFLSGVYFYPASLDILQENDGVAGLRGVDSCCKTVIRIVADLSDGTHGRPGGTHDEHGRHGEGAERVHEMAFFQNGPVPVDEIADCPFGQHVNNLHD